MKTDFRYLKEAEAIAGPLGKPSKMPGYAYGLPARNCPIGSILVKIKGTVCHGCYALKGRYTFAPVLACQRRRLESIKHPRWVEAMVFMIRYRRAVYFRWHDSGDLQGPEHFRRICEIAEHCPNTHFWLPTRERTIVRGVQTPENLVVRVSATMIDGPAPYGFINTSTVTTKGDASCPARFTGGQCGSCRSCWDPDVANVSYPKH